MRSKIILQNKIHESQTKSISHIVLNNSLAAVPLWCCHPNKYCDGSNYISQPNNRTRRNRPSEQGVCLFVSEKAKLFAAPENVAAARLWWIRYKVVIPRLLLQNTANVVYSNSSAFACKEEIKEWMCCSSCSSFIIFYRDTDADIWTCMTLTPTWTHTQTHTHIDMDTDAAFI